MAVSSTLFAPIPLTHCTPSSGCKAQSTPTYSLDNLVKDIKAHLGQSSGIGSSDVNEEYLLSLVKKYASDPNDWVRYYYNCPGKNYTRNAIENVNHMANIVSWSSISQPSKHLLTLVTQLLLVWNPGKGSPIHDHANAHCIMKVLAGELTETVYDAPTTEGAPLTERTRTTHHIDQVTYISDQIGLHRVHNPHPTDVAVSLHRKPPCAVP